MTHKIIQNVVYTLKIICVRSATDCCFQKLYKYQIFIKKTYSFSATNTLKLIVKWSTLHKQLILVAKEVKFHTYRWGPFHESLYLVPLPVQL